MANYKVVDADKLDSDLKGLADKLRAKTNTEEEIDFPEGFDTALDNVGEDLNTEITEQEALIAELKETLAGKAKLVSPKEKDVNFYDYDGTLLHSFTVAEAQALSALPELPTQEGLICQGWNYDLETIKEYNRAVDVGATYITDDGKTRLYIKIAAEGRMDVPLYFSQTVANGVTIDWGDGSATETLSGTGKVNTVHTYASIGEYVISLDVADGCELGLGHASSSYCVMGSTGYSGKVYSNMLQKVEIGNGITDLTLCSFYECRSLETITIPNGVVSAGSQHGAVVIGGAFNDCNSLRAIILPSSMVAMSRSTFLSCSNLKIISIPETMPSIPHKSIQYCGIRRIVIPESVTTISGTSFNACHELGSVVMPKSATVISGDAFCDCYALASIVIPKNVMMIYSNAFGSCVGMKLYDFTSHTAVPTLVASDVFSGIPSDCEIRVPAALYDEWIAATNWSTYADKIVAV